MKKKLISAAGVLGGLYAIPIIASAAFSGAGFRLLIENVVTFVNQVLVPLIFALAFIVFIWGVFKYFILGGADESKRAEGKGLMMYAIIGFVLMVSLWGLVNFIAENFGFEGDTLQKMPGAPLPRGGGEG